MKKIKVHNKSERNPIEVAINKWVGDGNIKFCPINKNGSEIWSRTHGKGLVMVIKGRTQEESYYIKPEDVIKVYDDKVTRNDSPIDKMPY